MIKAPVPPPGSVIAGKYRVERVLGAGGMAVVVEATHLLLGQRVALKLLRADAAQAPGVLERFRQEAQIAAQLPGEHIVRATDVGQTEDGAPYLVMELLVGRDLEAEILARGRLPTEEAVSILLQACEGVAEAHAVGLIHRDLKPGNLFVTRRRDGSPLVKVLDFGISKLTHLEASASLTQTTSSFGTPLYMSPEQIQSAKHVDMRADQHALAAILYTLLAGRPPYSAPSVTALSVIIATQPPASMRDVRPDLPYQLEAAIGRALAKSPADRFPDVAAFALAIAPFGGLGADAAVRRIAGALASSRDVPPELKSSQPGFISIPPGMAPPPSDPGYGAPPGYAAPPAYGSSPGHGAPPGYPRVRSSQLQTSPALATAISRERAASARRAPFVFAVIGVSALVAAAITGIVVMRFAPRKAAEAAAPLESAAPVLPAAPSTEATAAAIASAPEPASSEAPPSLPSATPSASPAESSSASPPPSTSPSSTAGVAASPASRPSSGGSFSPAPAPTAPRPASSPARATSSKKPSDPGEVFGAKR
jgi:serine/threonine-protein kinase